MILSISPYHMLWICYLNRLGETILIHIRNICLYGELTVIKIKTTSIIFLLKTFVLFEKC